MMSFLDEIAKCAPVHRIIWMDEPTHLPKGDYVYDPTYSMFTEEPILLSNYTESDASFRRRVKERLLKK